MGTVTPLRPDRRYTPQQLRSGAYSILREGRLELRSMERVGTQRFARAVVHGHTGEHDVAFGPAGWTCSCPVEDLCHHITAAELVVHAVVPPGSADQPK